MRKVISRRIRRSGGGLNLAADVDAVIVVNDGSSTSTEAEAHSTRRIVQPPAAEAHDGRRDYVHDKGER